MAIRGGLVSIFNSRRFRSATRACWILALAALPALALIAAPQKSKAPHPAPKAPAPPAIPAAPFHAGENLNYTVQWSRINDAVTARLSVIGEQSFYGRPAWHVQAQAHTNNPLRYLVTVDDQFDSYASRMDLTGLQFEMYLHEQGKAENHIFRLSSVSSPAPSGATQVQVLPNTRDALGFAYYLRTVNWEQTAEVRAPVFDGRRIYEVRARVTTPRGEVSVRAGKFNATAIGLRVYDRGTELTDTKLTIWIAQDSAHTPVLIEVELPFGSGRVELLGAAGMN
jgi:hypothetical protein